jgi:hypothetical protein
MSVVINGSAGVTTNSGAVYDSLQTGTAVTASSTSVNFTGIPSWVKRITVMFQGVSTNGTSKVIVQLGDAGGVETSGYLGSAVFADFSSAATNFSSGFIAEEGANAAAVRQGVMTLSLINSATFAWGFVGNMGRSDTTVITVSAGTKALSETLTQVRITTVNGTDTFDAGTINIIYE